MREKEAKDAPCWYSSDEASAWTSGYNAAVADSESMTDENARLVAWMEHIAEWGEGNIDAVVALSGTPAPT